MQITIDASNQTQSLMLIHADFLGETWLCEVFENDKAKILAQFKCLNDADITKIVRDITKRGTIVKLSIDTPSPLFDTIADKLLNPVEKVSIIDQLAMQFDQMAQWLRMATSPVIAIPHRQS